MKDAMGLQHVSGPSLCKDSRVCSNPAMIPMHSFPPGKKGWYSQGQPVRVETTQEHASMARASSKQDSSTGARQGGVCNSYF